MKPTLYFYRCRWCQNVYSVALNHHISTARKFAEAIVYDKPIPPVRDEIPGSPVSFAVPALLELHKCDEQRTGIADFIGYREE